LLGGAAAAWPLKARAAGGGNAGCGISRLLRRAVPSTGVGIFNVRNDPEIDAAFATIAARS
jgi:hypothetical protein